MADKASIPNPQAMATAADLANGRLAAIERGDTAEAREALRVAARSIRDVLRGTPPDGEQSRYLEFVAAALDQICSGVDPIKALGLFGNKRLPIDRDIALFMAVGDKLDALQRESADIQKPVERAIAAIAERTQVGHSTVEAAWKHLGGEGAWRSAKAL